MIQPERIQVLRAGPPGAGRYVLYWMQASQRARWNHALDYAIERANALALPLVCVFGLTDRYPEANLRHYAFMLEGLAETQGELHRRGVRLVGRHASPEEAALEVAREAALLVVDRGYLRHQRAWRRRVAEEAGCPVVQVETDVVVPVEAASDKEEYAARTLRPRIHRALERFLVPLRARRLERDSLGLRLPGGADALDLADPEGVLGRMKIDRSVSRSAAFRGGTSEARRRLRAFIRHGLTGYVEKHSDPTVDGASGLSPYLHFGQVSPVEMALAVREAADRPHAGVPAARLAAARDAYLEQLIVRRELSCNYVYYNDKYDELASVPRWAREALAHQSEHRPRLYSPEQLERGTTGDRYWNAAQRQMVVTGTMAKYMRMYWGKRLLEWHPDAAEGYRVALVLNNKYQLDGRDPNSYAGVAWCFGKHDRPWTPHEGFGTVRTMTAAGLERKFDMEAYVRQVEAR